VVACSLCRLVVFIVIVVRVTVGYFLWTMLSSGCKLNLLIKQIWLKHECNDPLLVAVWQ
jgi:hypothetical protein